MAATPGLTEAVLYDTLVNYLVSMARTVEGAKVMRKLAPYDRFQILRRAADAMFARQKELGRLISQEEGKILAEGMLEASRAAETIELSAEEAKRLNPRRNNILHRNHAGKIHRPAVDIH